MINVKEIVALHSQQTERWHDQAGQVTAQGFYALAEENHLHNFNLWHEEDKARRDDCGFEYVYQAKRNIDQHNQKRNNMMEAMDTWVWQHYQPSETAPCHSETPGMIIDRLSILALKEYHMREQAERRDAEAAHIEKCQQKLTVIVAQRDQLQQCLQELLDEIQAKKRTFRVYHQFKMYNDPSLNPQLYKKYG